MLYPVLPFWQFGRCRLRFVRHCENREPKPIQKMLQQWSGSQTKRIIQCDDHTIVKASRRVIRRFIRFLVLVLALTLLQNVSLFKIKRCSTNHLCCLARLAIALVRCRPCSTFAQSEPAHVDGTLSGVSVYEQRVRRRTGAL